MSELLENFNPKLLMTSATEQDSCTDSQIELPPTSDVLDFDFDFNMDLSDISNFDAPTVISDIPTGGIDVKPVDLFIPSEFDSNALGYDNSGRPITNFDDSNFGQFAPTTMMPQQYMPMYAPQYQYAYPTFNYQPPPGYMLVHTSDFYGQPMMHTQAAGFSFTPAPEAPMYPSLDVFHLDEAETLSEVCSSALVRRSARNGGKKTTYQDPTTPSRDAAPVKRRKLTRAKVEKPAIELEAPISVITANLSAPVKDMQAFANRSIAVRHAEAIKHGKTVRPLNRFLCYRSAFADRTKQWASSGDNQNISRILGASWQIEPQSIVNFYDKCAALDFTNHLKAFPTYKYKPGQAKETKAKKAPQPKESKPKKKQYICAREVCPESDDEMILFPKPLDVVSESDDELAYLFGSSPPASPRKPTAANSPATSKYNLRGR